MLGQAFVRSETSVVQKLEICSEIISLSNNIGADAFGNIQPADIDEWMQECPIYDDVSRWNYDNQ